MTWWAVGAAAVGAIGSYVSSRNAAKAGKPTKTEEQLQQFQLEQLKKTSPMALDYLGRAGNNLSQAGDFWNGIYRGGRAGALSMLGPQLQQGDQQRQAALASGQRLMPRGGGSAEGRLGMMDSAFADRNNALLSLRPKAADMLAGIGAQFGTLGSSLFGSSSGASLGLIGSLQNQRGMAFDQQRAAGQSAWQIAQGLMNAYGQYQTSRNGGGDINGALPSSIYTNRLPSNAPGVLGPGGTG